MKICIFGTGAVGSYIAARLLADGPPVSLSLVGRGEHLAAMRERGLRLKYGHRDVLVPVTHATDDSSTLGPQDLVIVSLKAPSLPVAASALENLLASTGLALFVTNGIPWWWHHGLEQANAAPIPELDPDGELWKLRDRVVGCVCHSSAQLTGPGQVVVSGQDLWLMGDPVTSRLERASKIADLFNTANLHARVVPDIRRVIWTKLLTNASLNPVSALTRLPSVELLSNEPLRRLMIGMIEEALDVAQALGWDLRSDVDAEQLVSIGSRGPEHRTSMLQDVLGQRPLEVEAILGQLQRFARQANIDTPLLDTTTTLLRGLDHSRALHAQ